MSDGIASNPSSESTRADQRNAERFEVGQCLLGKYRIELVLGQGGMGTVVGARHIELGEMFAFKFMRLEVATMPEVVERFMREARSVARLRGEHVARVYDVGRLETGEPYMLMEYLSGKDLERVLEEQGPIPVEELVNYALGACDAIAEAHAAGIVHRDIKPSNLFLNDHRGKRVLKVLDFGISKEQTGGVTRLTTTHSLLGSPLYMSPEQALTPKVVDARSDIWSLGVSLYELATGEAPFSAAGIPEVVARILQERPKPPSALRPGIPRWFDEIVLRCLEKSAHARYQRVERLAEALQKRDATVGSDDRAADHAGLVRTVLKRSGDPNETLANEQSAATGEAIARTAVPELGSGAQQRVMGSTTPMPTQPSPVLAGNPVSGTGFGAELSTSAGAGRGFDARWRVGIGLGILLALVGAIVVASSWFGKESPTDAVASKVAPDTTPTHSGAASLPPAVAPSPVVAPATPSTESSAQPSAVVPTPPSSAVRSVGAPPKSHSVPKPSSVATSTPTRDPLNDI